MGEYSRSECCENENAFERLDWRNRGTWEIVWSDNEAFTQISGATLVYFLLKILSTPTSVQVSIKTSLFFKHSVITDIENNLIVHLESVF